MIRFFSAGACRTWSKRPNSFFLSSFGAAVAAFLCLFSHGHASAEPALLTVTGFGSPNGPVASIRPLDRFHRPYDLPESTTFSADFGGLETAWAAGLVDGITCVVTDDGYFDTTAEPAYGSVYSSYQFIEVTGSICYGATLWVHVVNYQWNRNVPAGSASTDSFKMIWTPNSRAYVASATEDITATADLQLGPGGTTPPPPPPPPKPTISGEATMWWFNSQTPDETNYPTKITLTANPGGATQYNWEITNGNNQAAVFDANKSLKYSSNINTVIIDSTNGSLSLGDVKITVSYFNSSGQQSPDSEKFQITVRQPYRNLSLGTPCEPYSVVYKDPAYRDWVGYYCAAWYQTLDQFNTVPPNRLPLNENFVTTAASGPSYPNQNWWTFKTLGPCGPDSGGTTGGKCGTNFDVHQWYDQLGAGDPPGIAIRNPIPGNPVSYNGPLVVYWYGTFSVGSPDPGQGVTVQFHSWDFYLDHADQEDIHSPDNFDPPD